MIVISKEAIPEYIVENIINKLKCSNNECYDDYYDALFSCIDDWVVGNTDEAKELVEDFGVLQAIRLYKQKYGDILDLDEDDDKIYMNLSYCIIKEWFGNYY